MEKEKHTNVQNNKRIACAILRYCVSHDFIQLHRDFTLSPKLFQKCIKAVSCSVFSVCFASSIRCVFSFCQCNINKLSITTERCVFVFFYSNNLYFRNDQLIVWCISLSKIKSIADIDILFKARDIRFTFIRLVFVLFELTCSTHTQFSLPRSDNIEFYYQFSAIQLEYVFSCLILVLLYVRLSVSVATSQLSFGVFNYSVQKSISCTRWKTGKKIKIAHLYRVAGKRLNMFEKKPNVNC